MRLINIGGDILWASSGINKGLLFTLVILFSCEQKNPRIDIWKYQSGLKEVVVKDTIADDQQNEFNNPYMQTLLLIDSVIEKSNIITLSGDTAISIGDIEVNKTQTVEFTLDSSQYELFRGDINDPEMSINLTFIYETEIGVIAYYVYGRGYVKLISRAQGDKLLTMNEAVYDEMIGSDVLFHISIPADSVTIYDIDAVETDE